MDLKKTEFFFLVLFVFNMTVYSAESEVESCPKCLEEFEDSKNKVSHPCHKQEKYVHVSCFKEYLESAVRSYHSKLRDPTSTQFFNFKIFFNRNKIISYQIKCLNCIQNIDFPAIQNEIKALKITSLKNPRSDQDMEEINFQEALILENILSSYDLWTAPRKPCLSCLQRWISSFSR